MKLVIALALAICVAATATACADRESTLVTSGEDVMHVRDLVPDAAAEMGEGVALGYRYDHTGLLMIDFWRSGGEFVLYRDRTIYTDVTGHEMATMVGVRSLDRLGVPFSYRFPPGLLSLLALATAGVLLLVYRALLGRHLIGLLADHRYEHAARTIAPPSPAWTIDQAVDHLTTLGETRGWARFNLRLLFKHMV